MSKAYNRHHGSCLCGVVQFEVSGAMRGVVNCHCDMCRRLHSAFGAHTKVQNSQLTITGADEISWYKSSSFARRGFCSQCGAGLFWQPLDCETTSIAAGTLDQPSELKTIGHIYTAELADFYTLSDGLAEFEGSADGALDSA